MSVMDDMLVNLLTKMTGLNQEEMQSLAENAIELLRTLDDRMKMIETLVSEIHKVTIIDNQVIVTDIKVLSYDKNDSH